MRFIDQRSETLWQRLVRIVRNLIGRPYKVEFKTLHVPHISAPPPSPVNLREAISHEPIRDETSISEQENT